jgi:hypothetical protein
MRLAELHNSGGALEAFFSNRTVAACSPREQFGRDVGLPETGMYVSVWQVMPVPDPNAENPGQFVGYGLIDSVADGGDSTNITIQPLEEMDSLYPFFPGTVKRHIGQSDYPVGAAPKCCNGYLSYKKGPRHPVGIPCGRPITRITTPYNNMTCDRCYPYVQKQNDEGMEAEKEMIKNHNDPGRQYRD